MGSFLATAGRLGLPILSSIVTKIGSPNPNLEDFPDAGVWRPPQWDQPALTMLTVPGTAGVASGPASTPAPGVGTFGDNLPGAPAFQGTPGTADQVYVFDAVLRLGHSQELRRTEHPVQTQANITDHAYLLPARVVLDIGMSDAMDSYDPSSWTGSDSKSVSAYQTMLSIQSSRQLVTLTTRLKTYSNMLIDHISTTDTNVTRYGLRASIVFRQVFLATVTAVSSGVFDSDGNPISQRPQATDSNPSGTVQATSPLAALLNQHQVTSPSQLGLPSLPNVAGAGTWSSNGVSGLPNLF